MEACFLRKEVIMRRAQLTVFIVVGLLAVILVSLALYINERQQRAALEERLGRVTERAPILTGRCEDGTADGQCGQEQPLKCIKGISRPVCGDCGCPTNTVCDPDGTCGGRVEETGGKFTFYIVPIGYDPYDREFLLRVELVKASLFSTTPVTDREIVVVEETLNMTDCITVTGLFDRHVQQYVQKRTGKGLPGVAFEGATPLYRYRIIGISDEDVLKDCGCAHALVYSPNVFVGGSSCSLAPHVALHEFGHTIGLCDEYDTCVYDETDAYMRAGFGHPCLNDKPVAFNSDCGIACCSETGACCNGHYADTKADGFFNIMGSSDTPPPRRLDKRTAGAFKAYFCDLMEACA